MNEAVCNGVVSKRPGWNENLRILREMADCKRSSLTDEDTCFGVALDKRTNRQGPSCLFICFLVTIVKKERLTSCCFFLGDILIGFKHHIFMISNEKGKWQVYQRKMS